MKLYPSLPEGYVESNEHNVPGSKKSKKLTLWIAVITFVVYIAGLCIAKKMQWIEGSILELSLPVLALLIADRVHRFPHEFIHKIVAKCALKSRSVYCCYEYDSAYTAVPNEYFDKTAFLLFILAPVSLMLIVITLLFLVLPKFLYIALLLVDLNNMIAGGQDILTAIRILFIREEILILDTGKGATVYVKKNEK